MGRYIAEALHEDADLWYHTWISRAKISVAPSCWEVSMETKTCITCTKHYKAMWPLLFVGLDPYTLAEFSVLAVFFPCGLPSGEVPKIASRPENVTHRNPAIRTAGGPPRSLPQPIRPWWQSSRINRIVLETRAWRRKIWSPHVGHGSVSGG